MASVSAFLRHPRLAPVLDLARREIGLIAGIAVLTLTALVFLRVADEVGEGETRALDLSILMTLRAPGDPANPVGPKWLELAAMDVTSLGSVTILSLIVLLVCGLFVTLGRKRYALWLLAAAAGGTALSQGLKLVFGRERPPMFMHAVEAMNPSFPSGHATLSAVIYLTLGALVARFARQRRVKTYALASAVLLTALVGCSRVYLGVHWPTDVLAGWCLGACWATACWLAALVVQRRWPQAAPGTDAS
jgi:undecaprenyl-diphosphatase